MGLTDTQKPFAERLVADSPLLLDGATGTELARRGFSVDRPGWTAAAIWEAPELLETVHRDYVTAGADVITANTFRLHAANLASLGREEQMGNLVKTAVGLARAAAAGRAWVVGSQAPIGDCYQSATEMTEEQLVQGHRAMAACLAEARVDALLVETHPSIREAAIATEVALETGLPVLASLTCCDSGRLWSGESLEEAVAAIRRLGPAAVLVNCVPAEDALAAIQVLRDEVTGPVGVYANTSRFIADGEQGRWDETRYASPEAYAALAAQWCGAGASLVGGCCGTGPAHIRAVAERLRPLRRC